MVSTLVVVFSIVLVSIFQKILTYVSITTTPLTLFR